MQNLKSTLMMVMALGLFVGLAGCGGDDDPTTPAGDTLTLDSGMAEDFTLQTLDVVNDMVSEVPSFASGEFAKWTVAKAELAKANSDSVTWDPAQNAWVFNWTGPLLVVEPPSYWQMNLDLWVQYRNALGTLQFPLGATSMEVRYGSGMDMHMVDGPETTDLAYDMNTHMVVSYLGETGIYGVVGTGDTVVDFAQTGADVAQRGRFTMDWVLDIAVSDSGCPRGTVTVNTQVWQLVANYDGQGNVNWVLTGPGHQASGSDFVGCNEPVN